MTVRPHELQGSTLSKNGKKTKPMIIILAVVLIILVFGVAIGVKNSQSFHTKQTPAYYTSAYCWSKVLTLAAHGEIAGAEGVNGATFECTHVIGSFSIYSEAHT